MSTAPRHVVFSFFSPGNDDLQKEFDSIQQVSLYILGVRNEDLTISTLEDDACIILTFAEDARSVTKKSRCYTFTINFKQLQPDDWL